MRIAINGFGRIGRNFLRTILLDKKARTMLEVAAINIGPANKEYTAHMFRYDTLMGTYPGPVRVENDYLVIDDMRIQIITEIDPLQINWSKLGIDWVVDCSGKFTKRGGAIKHIESGAKYVLISAPADGEDISVVPGVNEEQFNPKQHKIVSIGSCTTNAFIPMLKVINDAFTINCAYMTTVHAYTNTQVLLDVEHKDLRRARAAALNIIPTTTGAAFMLDKVLPELDEKVKAIAVRVPVAKCSLIDLTFVTKKDITANTINDACVQASMSRMKDVMGITMEPLVSSDFGGTNYSVVIDGLSTDACGRMGKLLGWYDNEWGYSVRMRDFLLWTQQQ